jgi:hypothetical protein
MYNTSKPILYISDILLLLKDFLFLFLFIYLSITQVGFLLGLSISPLHLPISILAAFAVAYLCQAEKKDLRTAVITGAILFIIFLISISASILLIDIWWDSRGYHAQAMVGLAEGWNPVYQSDVCDWNSTFCNPFNWTHNHYPKAQWLLSAGFYSLFGNIEVGKSVNILLTILAFIVAYEFSVNLFEGKRLISAAFATVFAANPVAMAQMFSGYMDGLLASSLTIYLLSLVGYFLFSRKKWLYQSLLILPYLVSLKFTGLAYAVILTAIIALIFAYAGKPIRNFVLITFASFVVAVVAFGFNPYVTNTLQYHHPFYPIHGKGTEYDVSGIKDQEFLDKNRFEKFLYTLFSVTDEKTNEPRYALPFTTVQEAITGADTRFSGFGPFFSGIFLIAVLQLLFLRDKLWRSLALLTFASVFFTSVGWWARLTPQVWLVVAFVQVGIFISARPWWLKSSVYIVLFLMVVNSALVFFVLTSREALAAKVFYTNAAFVRHNHLSVQLSDKERQWFEFYNTRKVREAIGEHVEIREGCAIEKSPIFDICEDALCHLTGKSLADFIVDARSINSSIFFGSQGKGSVYLLSGWSVPETWGVWSEGRSAQILLPCYAREDQHLKIALRMHGLIFPQHPTQTVTVKINGIPAGTLTFDLGNKLGWYEIDVPEHLIAKSNQVSLFQIDLHVQDPARPRDLGISEDVRDLGVGLSEIKLF